MMAAMRPTAAAAPGGRATQAGRVDFRGHGVQHAPRTEVGGGQQHAEHEHEGHRSGLREREGGHGGDGQEDAQRLAAAPDLHQPGG